MRGAVVFVEGTVLYCTVLYCTVLYCTVLHCTVLYCRVLQGTAGYCRVLQGTVLYCEEGELENSTYKDYKNHGYPPWFVWWLVTIYSGV